MKKLVYNHWSNQYCSERDLEALFRVTEDEEEEAHMLHTLIPAVYRLPPLMNGTEGSFIRFWDDNIRGLLEEVFTSYISVRDTDQGTSTGLCRPDFSFHLESVCVFRGEEKSNSSTGTHPREELLEKLNWTYDPAPYIPGQCLLSLIRARMTHRIRRVLRRGRRRDPCRNLTFEDYRPHHS